MAEVGHHARSGRERAAAGARFLDDAAGFHARYERRRQPQLVAVARHQQVREIRATGLDPQTQLAGRERLARPALQSYRIRSLERGAGSHPAFAGRGSHRYMPPATTIVWPVIQEPAGEARNNAVAAMSSGVPRRSSGTPHSRATRG